MNDDQEGKGMSMMTRRDMTEMIRAYLTDYLDDLKDDELSQEFIDIVGIDPDEVVKSATKTELYQQIHRED